MGMGDVGDPVLVLTCARFTDPEGHASEVKAVCDQAARKRRAQGFRAAPCARQLEGVEEPIVRFLLGHYPGHAVWLGGARRQGKIAMSNVLASSAGRLAGL